MPAYIGVAIYWLIVSIVQSAIFVAVMALLEPLIDKAKASVQERYGLSDDDSTTYIANFIIDVVELAGLTVISLKTRLPLAVANKLGFTSKGFNRRGLPAKVSTGPNAPGAAAKSVAGVRRVPTAAEASVLIATVKRASAGAGRVFTFLERRLNSVFLAFLVSASFLDFANWETGAYSQGAQAVLEKVTFGLIKPDADYRKTKTVSPEVFDKAYNTFKLNGAVAIGDPFKRQSVIFTRDNMIDLLDQLGAQSLLSTGSASTADMLTAATPMIRFDFATAAGGSTPPTASTSGGGVASSSGGTSYAVPKVFTGVITQGMLGNGNNFTPRPDDLIIDLNELREAAQNNIAPFLAALPSRVTYEIKIVTSYIDRSGFQHRGSVQQVQTGTYTDGRPKYKMVINRFAIANLYVSTSRGTRSKIDTIVLGPTDAVRFQPQPGDVEILTEAISKSITTSYSSAKREEGGEKEGKKKEETRGTEEKVEKVEKEKYTNESGQPALYTEVTENPDGSLFIVWRDAKGGVVDNGNYFANSATFLKLVRKRGVVGYEYKEGQVEARKPRSAAKIEKEDEKVDVDRLQLPIAKDAIALDGSKPSGCMATTLFEYYSGKGQPLPSVEARQPEYEGLGLGPGAFYIGTSEQNMKLLGALQAQDGC